MPDRPAHSAGRSTGVPVSPGTNPGHGQPRGCLAEAGTGGVFVSLTVARPGPFPPGRGDGPRIVVPSCGRLRSGSALSLGDLRGRPLQRRTNVLDIDLEDRPVHTLLVLMSALLQPAGHDRAASPGEGLCTVLCQLPEHRTAQEQRVAVGPLAGRLI